MRVAGPFPRASLHESHRLESLGPDPNRRTEEVLAGSRFPSIVVEDTLEERRRGDTRAKLFSLCVADRLKGKASRN